MMEALKVRSACPWSSHLQPENEQATLKPVSHWQPLQSVCQQKA